jgi:hypothetical protein
LAVLALVFLTSAPAGAASEGGGRVALDVDLGETDLVSADLFMPAPLDVAPLPPEPHEAPVVVPLPPALGPGLAGLGTLAAMHVGRRAYRRR